MSKWIYPSIPKGKYESKIVAFHLFSYVKQKSLIGCCVNSDILKQIWVFKVS